MFREGPKAVLSPADSPTLAVRDGVEAKKHPAFAGLPRARSAGLEPATF